MRYLLIILVILLFSINIDAKKYKVKRHKPNAEYNLEQDLKEFLNLHNNERNKYGCSPLIWDDSLAKIAQEWANYLVDKNAIYHRNDSELGENIFWGGSEDYTLVDAAKSWLSERKKFKGRKFHPKCKCSHYTQIIWKNSKKIGAAIIRKNGVTICVAEYSPAGNYLNENVY